MQKAKCVFSSFFLFALTIFEAIVPANAEDVKITTYYPSPYGAYKELSTTGDTNLATDPAAKVGIGTLTPSTRLVVASQLQPPINPDFGNPDGKYIEFEALKMWGLEDSYGALTTWDTDSIFVGLKNEGVDNKDAVIAWGDNSNAGPVGPDTLRFLFTSVTNPGLIPPLEIMRLTPGPNSTPGTVAIGTTTPASSAVLDVASTNKGFLPPRVFDATSAVAAPATGLMVYDTNDNQMKYYNGTAWVPISGGGQWRVANGYYTGNGGSQTFNVGFTPTSVEFGQVGNQNLIYLKTNAMPGNTVFSSRVLSGATQNGAVAGVTIIANGFVVEPGVGWGPNNAGGQYYYKAYSEPS